MKGWALVVVISAILVNACGGMRHLAADSAVPDPVEPYLVQVVDQMPDERCVRVSLSALEVATGEKMPPMISEEGLEEMRRHAASRGAQWLWVERVETRWRRAFYGSGLMRQSDAPGLHEVPSCSGTEFDEVFALVQRQVARCLRDLKKRRTGLRGEAAIRMLIDGGGRVYGAGISPDSSRDGEVRRCFLAEAWRARYGPMPTLMCAAGFSAALP